MFCRLTSKFARRTINSTQGFLSQSPRFFSSETPTSENAFEHCMNLVKEKRPELYQTTLFLPAAQRPLAYALYAFTIEFRSIPDVVTNENLGMMRALWWKNAFEAVQTAVLSPEESTEAPPQHPIIQAFAQAVQFNGFGFDFELFERFLDAEEKIIMSRGYSTLPELIADLDASEGALQQLLVTVGAHYASNTDEVMEVSPDIISAAVLLGRAIGLVETLQKLPFTVRKNNTRWPVDLLYQDGVRVDELLRSSSDLLGLSNKEFFAELAALKKEDAVQKKQQKGPDTSSSHSHSHGDAPCNHHHGEDPTHACGHTHTAATDMVSQAEALRRNLQSATRRMANIAQEQLDRSREYKSKIPRPLRCYFLTAARAQAFLDKLKALDYDVFDPSFQYLSPKELVQMQLILAKNGLFKTF